MAFGGLDIKLELPKSEGTEEKSKKYYEDKLEVLGKGGRWERIAIQEYMSNNPSASEEDAIKALGRITSAFKGSAEKGNANIKGIGVDDLKYLNQNSGAYQEWVNEYWFPKLKEEGKTATGNLNELKIPYQNYIEQEREIEKIKLPDTVKTESETTPATVDTTAVADQYKQPDYSDLTAQMAALGGSPEQLAQYRQQLTAQPQMEQMAPEFADYLKTTLEGIEAGGREQVRATEEQAARGGLSAYSQRSVREQMASTGREMRGTEAGLKLQDLEARMADYRNRQTQQREFLSNEYTRMSNTGIQLAEMFQRRKDETDDQYRARTQYLQDELRTRGYSLQDIDAARQFQREGETIGRQQQLSDIYTGRRWNLSDAATARNQQLQDYERQKADYNAMLEKTKPQTQPWWQQALGSVATGAGYALGGPIGGAVASGATSLLNKGTQAVSGMFSSPQYQNSQSTYSPSYSNLNVPNYYQPYKNYTYQPQQYFAGTNQRV